MTTTPKAATVEFTFSPDQILRAAEQTALDAMLNMLAEYDAGSVRPYQEAKQRALLAARFLKGLRERLSVRVDGAHQPPMSTS